jgi:phosphoribosylanthranilate isomerase
VEDGLAAAESGADALGFVLYEASPRYVGIAKAAEIISKLPSSIPKVGVFVNSSSEFVQHAAADCGLHILQFHGAESPEFCRSFGTRWETMKAFQMRDESSLEQLPKYDTQAWLLDAWSASRPGGIGESFNWDLAVKAVDLGRRIFLAGGLTPENVRGAIERVKPYGVDVSSGVEESPGKKSHEKLRAFIRAVRSAKTT